MTRKLHPWPSPIGRAAYFGVIGEYLEAIEPHSEADPAAILVQALVCVGNAMGRGPHFTVEDTRHGTNLFAVVVGKTSSARKGTSLDRAQRLVRLADPAWAENNDGDGGLSTSEGLISAVQNRGNDLDSEHANTDKRLLAAMGEFGETLTKMGREGNTLSATLRQAWDGKTLRTRTKTYPMTSTGAHVSVIGHITQADLHSLLGNTSIFNGFGNRFLWVVAKQSRELPFGGELRAEALYHIVDDVRKSCLWCAKDRNIDFDSHTRDMWPDLYSVLGNRGDTAFDAITDRAVAQVRRLALVYAALDRSRKVRRPHLEAALAVWQYCEDSAAYVFAEVPASPLETTILRVLERNDRWLALSALSRLAFKGKASSRVLQNALNKLASEGIIERRRVQTAGRPRTEYRMRLA